MASPLTAINNGRGGELPVAPLVPLILEDAKMFARGERPGYSQGLEGSTALAEHVGLTAKRLNNYTSGRSKNISLEAADRYLTRTGRHLAEVWPWLYTPEQAAADVAATHDPAAYRRGIHAAAARRHNALKRAQRAERVAS